MTDLEARLEQALTADDPAARDPMFRIQVLMRRERAAIRRQLGTSFATVVAVATVAPFGIAAVDQLAGVSPLRLAAVATAGVALTCILAASCLGQFGALHSLAGRWRAIAGARLWF